MLPPRPRLSTTERHRLFELHGRVCLLDDIVAGQHDAHCAEHRRQADEAALDALRTCVDAALARVGL